MNSSGQLEFTTSSDPVGALNAAAAAWASIPTASIRFAPFQATTTLKALGGDGLNVITAEDTPEDRSIVGSFLALTIFSFDAQGHILDSDIVFNPQVLLNGAQLPFSTAHESHTYDTLGLATHEIGHSLGAAHSPVISATMFQAASPFDTFVTGYEGSSQSIISADDAAFASSVYPVAGASFGRILGRVKLDTGLPVLGALVVAASPATNTVIGGISSLTDGTYTLTGIPPGSYIVYAQPLDGPVTAGNFALPKISSANVSFRTTFAGGNTTPASIGVAANAAASADIVVSSQPSGLHIQYAGTGSAGGNDWSSAATKALAGGQARDILLWGPGMDASITEDEIRFLTGGVTLRPGTLHLVPSAVVNGFTALRFTVDVAMPPVKAPVCILVEKSGDVTINTGTIFVIGPPSFEAAGVVNAASFQGGSVVPGEIVTVFGADFGTPTLNTLTLDSTGKVSGQLADTQVLFDGVASPMVYEVAGQLSAVTPYEVAGVTSTKVVVKYNGAVSAPIAIPVRASSPALFTLNSSGSGQAAALNQDNSLNGPAHPAPKGSVVVLYGTGMGMLNPMSADGAVTPGLADSALPVQIQIGGETAHFTYAGGAPGLVSGVFQLNVQIPSDAASGAASVLVTVGSASSPAGITIAVQ